MEKKHGAYETIKKTTTVQTLTANPTDAKTEVLKHSALCIYLSGLSWQHFKC